VLTRPLQAILGELLVLDKRGWRACVCILVDLLDLYRNLLRLTDYLVYFVSVHGPPLKIVPLVYCG